MRWAREKAKRPTPVAHMAGAEDRQSSPDFSHLTNGQGLRDRSERVDRASTHDEGNVRFGPSFQGLLGPVRQVFRQSVRQVEFQTPDFVGPIQGKSEKALRFEE